MAARDIRGVLRPAAPVSSPGLFPEEQPLTWPRWDDGTIRLSVVNQDGSPVNVTGWQFVFTARERNDAGLAAALLSRSGAITSASGGLVSFGINALDWSAFAELRVYRHDVVGIDPDGARHQLVPQSTLTVLPAVGQIADVPTIPASPSPLPYPVASLEGEHGIAVDNTDPQNPIVSLGWDGLVGNNQLIARVGDGLVGLNDMVARWALSLCRYFLVDNEGGDDANDGFVDAAIGATINPAGKAIKTLDKLWQIFPLLGAGRAAVILLKGRTSGLYVDQANAAAAFRARGILGYHRLIVRGSTDLTNSAADQLKCGGRTAPGCSAGGYNVTAQTFSVSAVANTTPMQITTSADHGLATGETVVLTGVAGIPTANGEYAVTVTGAQSFTLDYTRAVAGEAYTSGGTVTVLRCQLNGGGAPDFPSELNVIGYRIRFDEVTATATLRNTCYEVFMLGGATLVGARTLVAASPAQSDVFYIEESGARFTEASIQCVGAGSLTGIGADGAVLVHWSSGVATAANFSVGGVAISFVQAGLQLAYFGGASDVYITNLFFNEADAQIQNGGNRAREYVVRNSQSVTFFRNAAFGTVSPNFFWYIKAMPGCHSNRTQRGFDFLGCFAGGATLPTASFPAQNRIGNGRTANTRRNRLGTGAHGASINLVGTSARLDGNFFNGSTLPCVNPQGVNLGVVIDDCVGSCAVDVAGVDLTNAHDCSVVVGKNNASSIGGTGGKEVQTATGSQVTYATLRSVGPGMDGRLNRISGQAPLTAALAIF